MYRYNRQNIGASWRWLVHEREHTNLTYDLTAPNREELVWFTSSLLAAPRAQIEEYFTELESDSALAEHCRIATGQNARGRLANSELHFSRRLAWYAIVRHTRPKRVLEIGTDKGLGSLVVAAALMRNGVGHVVALDINPDAGYLLSGAYSQVGRIYVGDLTSYLASEPGTIDLVIHDSHVPDAHEHGDYQELESFLASSSMIVADNSHATTAIFRWASETKRSTATFHEVPANHWYPGGAMTICKSER